MSLKDFIAENVPASHPKGWEPSITWNGKEGTLNTGPIEGESDDLDPAIWANLISDWGLNPDVTQVVDGSVQLRAWDANLGDGNVKRFRYYRASIVARQSAADRVDVDDLCVQISKRKPPKGVAKIGAEDLAQVILLSDWQLGKGEGGGTPAAIERIEAAFDGFDQKMRELRSVGRGPSAIYVVGMGDIVEQCDGHYPMQAFQTDLDRRGQKKVARRLILGGVRDLSHWAIPIVLGAVPGNHGENRRDGKAFTTFTDNDDLAVVEEVAEILEAGGYDNVSVPTGAIAEDLTMTLDIAGVTVGFAHGHQMRSGGAGSQAKLEKWFQGQALGRQPVASADILFTGHFHHLLISEATGRTVVQCPAMDGGSAWWTASTGQNSPAGMLSIGVGAGYGPRGWGDLDIHTT